MRATAGPDLVHVGGHRLRIGPWRRGASFGYVVPLTAPDALPDAAIDAAVGRLAAQGYRSVLTTALLPDEQGRFLRCGFVVEQRLHLLHADLRRVPPGVDRPVDADIRRARRAERGRILSIDHRAFDEFWRLDDLAYDEARRATPRSRVRVAADDGRPVGYAITGRSGPHGYLQRLAVDPDQQGRGIGRALVLDALGWLRRHGVRRAAVNTQEHNVRALALYEHIGFQRQPGGLAVLRRDVR